MKVRLTFRSEIYLEGESMEEIKASWFQLPIFSKEADSHCAEIVDMVSVENEETYEDLMEEFNSVL